MSRRTLIYLVVAMSSWLVFAPIVTAVATSSGQLSPAGGIGNTRADFSKEWGPLRSIGEPFVAYQQEYVNYETKYANVTVSVMYLMEPDGRPRTTDRVGWFMINLMDSTNQASAKRLVSDFLPEDAKVVRTTKNRLKEPREVYKSEAAAKMFPTLVIDEETIKPNGEIFVTYGDMGLGGYNVVAIEVGLYDDQA